MVVGVKCESEWNSTHRMQIWRTTRSAPGMSRMEARLVRLSCFVLKMLPQKTLALSSICSVLFRCAYEFLNATRRDRNLPPFTSKGK